MAEFSAPQAKLTINKAEWLLAGQCPAMAWFGLRAPQEAPDEAARFRMKQGQEIGALAREVFPDGILVSRLDTKSSAELTKTLLSAKTSVIFEATFQSDAFVAKADIVQREKEGWHFVEVKSRFSDTKRIDELVDDLAYTVTVAKRTGVQIERASLMLLAREYRFGGTPQTLFHCIDVTKEVLDRVAEFEGSANSMATALVADTPPVAKLVSACRDCSSFATKCIGAKIEHTVLEIPSLHHKKLKRLSDEGIVNLADLPEDIGLNERQERAKDSALSGNRVVESDLAAALAGIQWPCFYLDFETVATVLPLYEGHGCHQQVLTQFSIHRRDDIASDLVHSEYLADPCRDCQREVAEALVQALEATGSVIVYSSFEKTRIAALRDSLPDLAEPLQRILDRLVDLYPLITDNIYYPEFKGSFSIKTVLPALVPELSYAGLDVRNGDTAIARFARMARGEITGESAIETRRQLLEYCKLDTLAMVRLHEALVGLAGTRRGAGGV
jgi:hypothetical protein